MVERSLVACLGVKSEIPRPRHHAACRDAKTHENNHTHTFFGDTELIHQIIRASLDLGPSELLSRHLCTSNNYADASSRTLGNRALPHSDVHVHKYVICLVTYEFVRHDVRYCTVDTMGAH